MCLVLYTTMRIMAMISADPVPNGTDCAFSRGLLSPVVTARTPAIQQMSNVLFCARACAGNGGGGLDASWEAACQEFAELCRRNKRARQAAQAALLPQELAAAVDDGAKRRGGA